MLAVAPWVLPPGRVVIAADHVLTALEVGEATYAATEGDLVPAGRYFVAALLAEEFPFIPWGFVI